MPTMMRSPELGLYTITDDESFKRGIALGHVPEDVSWEEYEAHKEMDAIAEEVINELLEEERREMAFRKTVPIKDWRFDTHEDMVNMDLGVIDTPALQIFNDVFLAPNG